MASSRKASVSKPVDDSAMACAMKLRVYLEPEQVSQAGQWLYDAHKFRNEAVAFLRDRRRQRSAWLHANRHTNATTPEVKPEIPTELAGNDVTACSIWLTSRLVAARQHAIASLGLTCDKRQMTETVSKTWTSLSPEERDGLGEVWLLTVPRTVLDQVLQDMSKTVAKAIKDRGLKRGKPAGFPDFRKWSFATSARMQVNASKNQAFRDHWAAGKVYLPGLGAVTFRDAQPLPATPPKLITLSRNAASQWHVSFVCVDQDTKAFLKAEKARQEPLPIHPATGLPVATGGDVGLTTTLTLADGQEHKRVRYANRQRRRLRNLSRGLARKTRGSKRWQKRARQVGKLHVKVANQREAGLTDIARSVVKANAIICLEDLFLKGLMQSNLAASLADAALGKLKTKIIRQAEKHGRLVLTCGRFTPSTQTCGICNLRHPEKLTLSDRTWTCTGCGITHERDHNAARVILQEGLKAACNELNIYTASGKGARAASSPESLPWLGLHPDLTRFIARGGLTALWAEQASESRRILEQSSSFQQAGRYRSRETRFLPDVTKPGRKGTARAS